MFSQRGEIEHFFRLGGRGPVEPVGVSPGSGSALLRIRKTRGGKKALPKFRTGSSPRSDFRASHKHQSWPDGAPGRLGPYICVTVHAHPARSAKVGILGKENFQSPCQLLTATSSGPNSRAATSQQRLFIRNRTLFCSHICAHELHEP